MFPLSDWCDWAFPAERLIPSQDPFQIRARFLDKFESDWTDAISDPVPIDYPRILLKLSLIPLAFFLEERRVNRAKREQAALKAVAS